MYRSEMPRSQDSGSPFWLIAEPLGLAPYVKVFLVPLPYSDDPRPYLEHLTLAMLHLVYLHLIFAVQQQAASFSNEHLFYSVLLLPPPR